MRAAKMVQLFFFNHYLVLLLKQESPMAEIHSSTLEKKAWVLDQGQQTLK